MIWNSVKNVFTIEKKGEEAIREIFEKAGFPELAGSVLERERFFSSSIGKGIYLIRRMAEVEEPVLFIGKSGEPMELEAYDGFPVRLLILALVLFGLGTITFFLYSIEKNDQISIPLDDGWMDL